MWLWAVHSLLTGCWAIFYSLHLFISAVDFSRALNFLVCCDFQCNFQFKFFSEKWFPIPNLYMLGALTQLIFLSKRPKFKFDCFNFINFILNKVLTVHQSDSDSKFAIVSSGIWFQGRLCNSVIRSYNHNDLTNTEGPKYIVKVALDLIVFRPKFVDKEN